MVFYVQAELSNYTGRTIYKFIAPDRRVYIGYASNSCKRINSHKCEALAKKNGKWKLNTYWKKAIRFFGWENLSVEILEFVPKWISLKDRERYWIDQYRSYDPKYGFNSNKGGGGVVVHTEESKRKMRTAYVDNKSKPVTSIKIKKEYTDGTQLVEYVLYPSATVAANSLGIHNQAICYCCLGHQGRLSAGGLLWRFTKDDDVAGEHRVPHIGNVGKSGRAKQAVISVLRLANGGAELQFHESLAAAAKTLSTPEKTLNRINISKCCKRERISSQGYNFYFPTTETESDFDKNFKLKISVYNRERFAVKKNK